MAAVRRTEDELNLAAGLPRGQAANDGNIVINAGGGAYTISSAPAITLAQSKSNVFNDAEAAVNGRDSPSVPPMPMRPQDEVASRVFDMLRSNDETMINLMSEVTFNAKQKKLTLKNAFLNNTYSQSLFEIIAEYKIEYLHLRSSPWLKLSDILDFIACNNNLHTVDLSNATLQGFQEFSSELPEKLGNLLLTNKTLKKLILNGAINLTNPDYIIDPIADGIANNDTLESLDLSNTSVINFDLERLQCFIKALSCNRSLTSLKLEDPSSLRTVAQNDGNRYESIFKKLDIIQKEINSNCERDSVELARQLANYSSLNQEVSGSAAAASNPLDKPISFLRYYSASPAKLASLSHNLYKALHHINIPKETISGLIPNIMSYAKYLLYSHHLFEILGITKNLAQEHNSYGAKDPLYRVLEFLTFDDIKYQQIEAPGTPALEEVSMAGAAASSDFEGKE